MLYTFVTASFQVGPSPWEIGAPLPLPGPGKFVRSADTARTVSFRKFYLGKMGPSPDGHTNCCLKVVGHVNCLFNFKGRVKSLSKVCWTPWGEEGHTSVSAKS